MTTLADTRPSDQMTRHPLNVRDAAYAKLSVDARRMLAAVEHCNGDDIRCWWVQLPKAARLAKCTPESAIAALAELREAKVLDYLLFLDAKYASAIVAAWNNRAQVIRLATDRVRLDMRLATRGGR